MIEFKLEGEYIQLIQLLKVTHLAQTGGEAQFLVTEGKVKCNGEVDFRKRLKLRREDIIEVNGQRILVK
ncbi:MAG: RNA-binding S4 domain-containing protein [Sphingobacteriaceae bacterium]